MIMLETDKKLLIKTGIIDPIMILGLLQNKFKKLEIVIDGDIVEVSKARSMVLPF